MSTDVINSCSAGYSESVRIAVSLNSEVFILRQLIRSISESVGIPIHELAGLLRVGSLTCRSGGLRSGGLRSGGLHDGKDKGQQEQENPHEGSPGKGYRR
eukprot:COSAG05_NODE_528_length_8915_cov_26.504651_2_plen_100_part_00